MTSMTMLSANAQDIKLPAPDLKMKSLSMIETLQKRHSSRKYDKNAKLSKQELSNLCWAACGQQRDDKHITSPTAMNKQEIRLYAFMEKGVYEYDVKANKLVKKADGDHRDIIAGGQDFVKDAYVSLLMVIDFDKFGSNNEKAIQMGCVDAGIVSENINLYCESVGLSTVPRATMDVKAIKELLKLTDKQMPIMNNPVGR